MTGVKKCQFRTFYKKLEENEPKKLINKRF